MKTKNNKLDFLGIEPFKANTTLLKCRTINTFKIHGWSLKLELLKTNKHKGKRGDNNSVASLQFIIALQLSKENGYTLLCQQNSSLEIPNGSKTKLISFFKAKMFMKPLAESISMIVDNVSDYGIFVFFTYCTYLVFCGFCLLTTSLTKWWWLNLDFWMNCSFK